MSVILMACGGPNLAQPSLSSATPVTGVAPSNDLMLGTEPTALPPSMPTVRPALRVRFDGPAPGNVRICTQDVPVYRFMLEALDDVEIRATRQRLGTDPTPNGFFGSSRTVYFRDIKWKDMLTGATLMGPTSLTPYTDNAAPWELRDSFVMRRGEGRRIAITMDIACSEDAPGELVGRAYHVVFIDGLGVDFFRYGDVLRLSDRTPVRPEEIEGNTMVAGNLFTVVAPTLNVSVASTPVHAETVKKARNVKSTGLIFTANLESTQTIRELTLTGQGNVDGTFRANAFTQIVTSCVLFDDVTQVGVAQSPDSSGRMRITNMNLRINPGQSRTLTVQCTNDSVVQQLAAGDRYSIGIASAADIVAVDDSELNAIVNLASGVVANASSVPVDFVTVHDRGGLSLEHIPSTQTVSLTRSGWQLAGTIRARAELEPSSIELVRIQLRGPANYVYQVLLGDALSDGGVGWYGRPVMTNGRTEMDYPVDNLTVYPGMDRTFQIFVLTNGVAESELPEGRVGFGIGFTAGVTTGEWDTGFGLDRLNVRAAGQVSGDRLFVRGPCDECSARWGNTFFTR